MWRARQFFDDGQGHPSTISPSLPSSSSDPSPTTFHWTAAEDLILRTVVQCHGQDWPKVTNDFNLSSHDALRSERALRARWKALNIEPRTPVPNLDQLWSQEEVNFLRNSLARHEQSFQSSCATSAVADFVAAFPESTRTDASSRKQCKQLMSIMPARTASSVLTRPSGGAYRASSSLPFLDVGIIYDGGHGVRIENCPRNHYIAVYSAHYTTISQRPPPTAGVLSFGQVFKPIFHFLCLEDGGIRALCVPHDTTMRSQSMPVALASGTVGRVAVDTLFWSAASRFSVTFRSAGTQWQ